jgi:hypothetical protein
MPGLVKAATVLVCGAAAAAGAARAEPQSVSPKWAVSAAALGSGPGPDQAIDGLLANTSAAADPAVVDWKSSEVRFSPKAAVRIRVGDPLAPGDTRAPRPPGFAGAQTYEFSLVQDWPSAVSFQTERFGLDLTPHAGVGVTSYGGLAEAGATLKLSQRMDDTVKRGLGAIGVSDGAKLGDQGRWYLFAAASGRAVGLNMLRGADGWSRAGWTTDSTSTLVGDAQVGVGWRKGPMQTSLGFVHREIKGLHTLYGQETRGDSLVAFSFSVREHK